MASARRLERIAALMKQVISEYVLYTLSDPRLKGIISITGVKVSRDLKFATVKFSVVGSEKDKKSVLAALISARKVVQAHVGNEIEIRHIPRITFELDESVERGMRIINMLREEFPNGVPEDDVDGVDDGGDGDAPELPDEDPDAEDDL